MTTIKFETGNSCDHSWLFSIYEQSLRPCIEKSWGWNDEYQHDGFKKNLSPEKWMIINTDSRRIGGFVLDRKIDHYWLEMVIVVPGFQKQGVGRYVIEHCKELSTKYSLPLQLGVIKTNPVKEFYLKLGFTQCSEDDSFFRMMYRS